MLSLHRIFAMQPVSWLSISFWVYYFEHCMSFFLTSVSYSCLVAWRTGIVTEQLLKQAWQARRYICRHQSVKMNCWYTFTGWMPMLLWMVSSFSCRCQLISASGECATRSHRRRTSTDSTRPTSADCVSTSGPLCRRRQPPCWRSSSELVRFCIRFHVY